MPIDFLTVTERERLNRFPDPIPDEELRVFFTLSDRDIQEVHKQRGASNHTTGPSARTGNSLAPKISPFLVRRAKLGFASQG